MKADRARMGLLSPLGTPRIPQPCIPQLFPLSPHSPPAAGAGSGAGPRSSPGSPTARGRCPRPAAGRRQPSAQAWWPRCPGNQPGPQPPRPRHPPGTSPRPVGHTAVTGHRDQPRRSQGLRMLQTLLGSHPSDRCHPSPEPVGDHSLTSRVGPAGSPAPLHPAGPGGTHKHQHVEDEHQVLHAAQDTHGDAEGTGFCRQTAAFVPAEGGAEPWPQPAPTCPAPWDMG